MLVIDLAEVTFCSSAGLSVLGFAQKGAGTTRFAVAAASEGVRRVLQLAGMDHWLNVYPSVGAALAENLSR